MNISVIIPMHNAESFILNALESVRLQNYNATFEIIIINDGSTDRSLSLVEAYKKAHSSLNIKILNQGNQGVSSARNNGLLAATGDFIAFLDADDVWLKDKTTKQLEFLLDKKLNINFITSFRNNDRLWFPYIKNKKTRLVNISLRKLLFKNVGHISASIFNRSVYENTGLFDEKQTHYEDANYWFKILNRNKMYLLPERLVITGNGKRSFGESGLSKDLVAMEKGNQKNISELYKTNRISRLEYLMWYCFAKLKYIIRIIRVKF